MSQPTGSPRLLALDPGVRESGWAFFQEGLLLATGSIGQPRHLEIAAAARVEYLLDRLDQVVACWQPQTLVCCQPSGIHWLVPSLELLESRLNGWSERHQLRRHDYTAQEVRAAVTGSAHTSRDQLAYTVMAALGRIGQRKSTHEWEAVAVGYYHLSQKAGTV